MGTGTCDRRSTGSPFAVKIRARPAVTSILVPDRTAVIALVMMTLASMLGACQPSPNDSPVSPPGASPAIPPALSPGLAPTEEQPSGTAGVNQNGSPRFLPGNDRPAIAGKTVVFAYEDFGPPAAAFGLGLGLAWYPWIGVPCGTSDGCLDDRYDIKVVVFRGMTEEEAARRYPTREGHADHRLIAYVEMRAGLERTIADLGPDPPGLLAEVRARYQRHRARLLAELGR